MGRDVITWSGQVISICVLYNLSTYASSHYFLNRRFKGHEKLHLSALATADKFLCEKHKSKLIRCDLWMMFCEILGKWHRHYWFILSLAIWPSTDPRHFLKLIGLFTHTLVVSTDTFLLLPHWLFMAIRPFHNPFRHQDYIFYFFLYF